MDQVNKYMKRPALTDTISVDAFKNYYWLKEELLAFCRTKGIGTSGSKMVIADRISLFLATGQVNTEIAIAPRKRTSRFDWNKAPLTLETVITDNYTNSENVRSFFVKHIGPHFRFTVEYMQWMKQQVGKTLNDALLEWQRLYTLKKDKSQQTEIAPQFEFNRYMRAFLADNPGKSGKEAIKFWKLKRALPGDNGYAKSDLRLSEEDV